MAFAVLTQYKRYILGSIHAGGPIDETVTGFTVFKTEAEAIDFALENSGIILETRELQLKLKKENK